MALKYQPSLDGLRALAVIGVICAHTKFIFPGGGRGVDVFFVLSGYLITTILLAGPSIRDFYIRRARRLLPALFLLLVIYLLLAPYLLPAENAPREAFLSLLYSTNWSLAFDYRRTGLAHTWSLSIEEQFYLLWPFLLILLKRSSMPLTWLGIAWLCLTALRFLWPDARAAYYISPFHATGLIVGAMIAFRRPTADFGWPALGAIVLCYLFGVGGGGRSLAIPVVEIATAFLISALLQPSRLTAAFAWRPLVWIGLISYGIYLWQTPIDHVTEGTLWNVPATFFGSIGLAAMSFYLVERRFLANKAVNRTACQVPG